MRASIIATALTLSASLIPAAAAAQAPGDTLPATPSRAYAGLALAYATPRGEFATQIDNGFGIHGHFLYDVTGGGWLGLRLEGDAILYGHERKRVPFSSTVGGRVEVDVTTSNSIASFGIGPQLGLPTGAVRPYVNGFAGVTLLSTTSSVQNVQHHHDGDPIASTTNHHDWTFAYGAGGGLVVPLRRGATPLSLDVGFVYRNSGEASYLRPGDITDNPDGSITIHPVSSRTDLTRLYIGISAGLSR
jgi:hypothetical protein